MKSNELSQLIKQVMKKRGLENEKLAARRMGVSIEILRDILRDNHVPKDRTLLKIARGLGIDPSPLIMAAVRLRLPRDLGDFMLPVGQPANGDWSHKRKWPLSQEQCEYLARIMNSHEIQFLRKYRQLSDAEKNQIVGYVNYTFDTKRIPHEQAKSSDRKETDNE